MTKKIFRKNRKGLAFFVLLDLWSIIAVVGFLILLLIYINFTEKVQEKRIADKIVGSNFPHYIISSFESEVVDFKGCAGIPENITRTEFLVWLDYNKEFMSDKELENCVNPFRHSLLKFTEPQVKENFGAALTHFAFTVQGERIVESSTLNMFIESKLAYEIPAKNENIQVSFGFTAESLTDVIQDKIEESLSGVVGGKITEFAINIIKDSI